MRGGGEWQLQAVAMIYAIVAAVSVLDAAAARREQRTSFALIYRQARRSGGGGYSEIWNSKCLQYVFSRMQGRRKALAELALGSH